MPCKPSRRAQGKLLGCPDLQGGVNYFPTTYSERTHLSYGGGIEVCFDVTPDTSTDNSGFVWFGGTFERNGRITGSVTAMDPATGKKVAQQPMPYAVYSGVTSTAGGLVFTTTANGTIWALDDETLKPLWKFQTGAVSSAPPMTYSVNGKQYVAVLLGGHNPARDMLAHSPEYKDIQQTSMLYVFSL